MTTLPTLQIRFRLEELCERFRTSPIAIGDDALRVPYAQLSHVRVKGRLLDADAAWTRAEQHKLVCNAEGITLPLDGSIAIEALEDQLIGFFEGLVCADPTAFLGPPPRRVEIPETGDLPQSAVWLERFYQNGFLPREKKPAVVDLARSQGPFLRSVDDDPLQIVDSASQIASLAAGFRPDAVQAELDEGGFDPALTSAVGLVPRVVQSRVAGPALKHITFTNSGAEAVEKALHLARRYGGGKNRVIAFEGSFHGRTLLALFSTWNPVKREPYQLPGFETDFVKFPTVDRPGQDPVAPKGWREAWSSPAPDAAREFTGDALLQREVAALKTIEEQLSRGDAMAVLVEPYQCEGGDRGGTPRFFTGLRALTRAYKTALIFDEVQSGFALGGPFFWHQKFWITDANGQPDGPDLVVCAKRAQTGVVFSRWPDPYPTSVHTASQLRGAIHQEVVHPHVGLSTYVVEKLDTLAATWPRDLVTRGRVYGDAFAFDLPSKEVANHLIGQRFYRGIMVYIAGERTLRYRLNRAMTTKEVDWIFRAIDQSIAYLVDQSGGPGADLFARMKQQKPPAWAPAMARRAPRELPGLTAVLGDDTPMAADRVLRTLRELGEFDRVACNRYVGLPENARGDSTRKVLQNTMPGPLENVVGVSMRHYAADLLGTRVRRVAPEDFDKVLAMVSYLESDAYEAARRDPISYLRTVAEAKDGIMLVAEASDGMVGMSFAAPLELWWGTDGPAQDPNRGQGNTLYSADITVAERARGRGIGWRLRLEQLKLALTAKTATGAPRYAFITGRNRMGVADAMWSINRKLGAYTARVFTSQYGVAVGRSRYYRIPLRRYDRREFAQPAPTGVVTQLSNGVAEPCGPSHPLLERGRALGVFDQACFTKLTVSNFITRPYVRYAEYMRALRPRGTDHLYFTSSLDELVDKSVRVLKHKRKDGHVVVGLSGGYFGHTTAAARSLSDWSALHGAERDAMRAPPDEGYFGWPRVSHPSADPAATISALDALVATHGADALLGVYVESVQAKTGRALSAEAWSALCAWRDRTGVPIVLSETTTGCYRSGHGPWWLDGVEGDPDCVLWHGGGQLGHIFCSTAVFVEKPLAFISTWDGDELSATRNLWQLYAAAQADVAAVAKKLDEGLAKAGYDQVEGVGLYRVLTVSERRADLVTAELKRSGLELTKIGPRRFVICPPVTVDPKDIDRLLQALTEADRK